MIDPFGCLSAEVISAPSTYQVTEKEATMIYQLLERLDRVIRIEPAKAHCDIPCGIYDPITTHDLVSSIC